MPEEFRQWKESVDAAVARRKALLLQQQQAASQPAPVSASTTPTVQSQPRESAKQGAEHKKHHSQPAAAAPVVPTPEPVTYATLEAAAEAFRSLLEEFQVTSAMKFKEVQELCSHDQRWAAHKTTGEKKQNLAEFQTKKMKQEREVKKTLARRARDTFLVMLAECHAIDSNTRWRDAMALLESDKRYKEVESAYDREDYFNEFLVELKKRERAEKEEMKKEILLEFQTLLQGLVEKGKVTHLTIWNELKSEMIEVFGKGRLNQLEEYEKRRVFQDYIFELQSLHREEERKAREERLEVLHHLKAELIKEIERIIISLSSSSPPISGDGPRWREISPLLEVSTGFLALVEFLDKEKVRSSPPSLKLPSPRDIFEEYMTQRRDELRYHKRLFFDILDNYPLEITHHTLCEELIERFQAIYELNKDEEKSKGVSFLLTSKEMATLHSLLTSKRSSLMQLVNELLERKREEWSEKERHRRKLEDRYLDLLDDLFNRSDQIELSWEDARQELVGSSPYEALGKAERKKLFEEHMSELKVKLEEKMIKANELKALEEIKLQEMIREREEVERAEREREEREREERDREALVEAERQRRGDPVNGDSLSNGSGNGREDEDASGRHGSRSRHDRDQDESSRKRRSHEEKRESESTSLRKKSRHDSDDEEEGGGGRGGSSKGHKKERKDRDKDRDQDRDRERDRDKEKDRNRDSDKDRRKHRKVSELLLLCLFSVLIATLAPQEGVSRGSEPKSIPRPEETTQISIGVSLASVLSWHPPCSLSISALGKE
jgi:hypothetical protein